MKKIKLVVGIMFLGALGSCNQSQSAQEEEHAHYACPMTCEGDKTYHEDGTCPACKMDLEDVAVLEE
ncbi:MAG: protein SCO1/2 [Arcticibacterium sp.]|jgi:protein SCO1/2